MLEWSERLGYDAEDPRRKSRTSLSNSKWVSFYETGKDNATTGDDWYPLFVTQKEIISQTD